MKENVKKRLLPKAISFDIYGTIIDWEGGTIEWYQRFMDKHHITHVSAARLRVLGRSCSSSISGTIAPSVRF